MKKTFKLTHEKIKPERQVEAVKNEIRKYIKRERNKPLSADVDYVDFDCRFGADEESSEEIHLAEIDKSIAWAVEQSLDSFYIEIISKPGIRSKQAD